MVPDALLDSLRRAVEAEPDDVELRVHLARLLAEAGRGDESVFHAAGALQRDPRHAGALRLLGNAATADRSVSSDDPEAALAWLEEQFDAARPDGTSTAPFSVEDVSERLSDVGGMDEAKRQLDLSVLTPLRDPGLGEYYGRTGHGGLLLYGPPGCGKTFLARALAGELGAKFLSASPAEVHDAYIGQPERNVAALFALARENAPCVLFFDELDGIGRRRGALHNSGVRTMVNQLLTEMSGVRDDNNGVFVLGATNHPWDLDDALYRPGRLDRSLFIAPPDAPARAAIFAHHLRLLPTSGVDVVALARQSDGWSGADIAHVCGLAAENVMAQSQLSGIRRAITTPDLIDAAIGACPSVDAWFDTARTVVEFANVDGRYDQLAAYLQNRRSRR